MHSLSPLFQRQALHRILQVLLQETPDLLFYQLQIIKNYNQSQIMKYDTTIIIQIRILIYL